MSKRNKVIIFSLLLLYPMWCFSEDLNNIHIQINKKILPIKNAIELKSGTIKQIEKTSVFKASIQDRECSTDFSEENNRCIDSIFPAIFYVKIVFFDVKPKKNVYIDGSEITTTNSEGQSVTQIIYLDPGSHNIELKNKNKIVDYDKIHIQDRSTVKCSGRDKMQCSVLPLTQNQEYQR